MTYSKKSAYRPSDSKAAHSELLMIAFLLWEKLGEPEDKSEQIWLMAKNEYDLKFRR